MNIINKNPFILIGLFVVTVSIFVTVSLAEVQQPFTNIYIEPSPVNPSASVTVTATGITDCSTYINYNFGAGLTSCTQSGGYSCSGNPKGDGKPCWWRWSCKSGTTPGTYTATFDAAGTNCASSKSYTINSVAKTGGINGTVRKLPDNSLLHGVTVSLVGTARTMDTDATGGWAMKDIPSGPTQFTFSKAGFVPKTATVTIPDGLHSVSFHIQLAPASNVIPIPTPSCVHPAPSPGCHWEGSDVYPTCDVKLVCSTPIPTSTPVTIAGITFNGSALDISGKNTTTTTIKPTGTPAQEIIPVVVNYSQGNPRTRYIKFIYQPLTSPTPTPTPTPPSSVVVCDGNSDQLKINNAINALPTSGGTVTLPGRQCNLASTVVITKDNVTLQGQGSSTILYLNNNANANVISALNKTNLHIKNLKIDGNKDHQITPDQVGLGIRFNNVGASSIENVIVQNTKFHGIGINNPGPNFLISGVQTLNTRMMGIVVDGTPQNITITGSTIANPASTGLFIRLRGSSSKIRLENNNIKDPKGHGIQLYCSGATLDALWIINNTVSGMHDVDNAFGIWVLHGGTAAYGCDNAQKYIQNNKVLPNGPNVGGPAGDHFGLRGNNGILTGNYSEGSRYDGYALGAGHAPFGFEVKNWTIKDNKSVNNGVSGDGSGFMIYRIRNSIIANNVAFGNASTGITLLGGLDNVLENNTIYNNNFVYRHWRGGGINLPDDVEPNPAGAQRNTLRGNRIYNNYNWGIKETGMSDFNTLICNNVYGNTEGQIVTVGPHTTVAATPCAVTPTPASATITSTTINGNVLDLIRSFIVKFIYQPPATSNPAVSPKPAPTAIQLYDSNNDGVTNSIDYSNIRNSVSN